MAEVLKRFAETVVAGDGSSYVAQACGAPNAQGLWDGWIEFAPVGKGTAVRSPRETTQPNRVDAEYWATGLTPIYLEGALHRALHPVVRHVVEKPQAMFDGPAAAITTSTVPRAR